MNFIKVSIVLALILAISAVSAFKTPTCEPGTHPINYMGTNYCYTCGSGHYCPDGVREVPCPANSVSGMRATTCTPCTDSRADSKQWACLLKDAPASGLEMPLDGSIKVNVVSADKPAYFHVYCLPNYMGTTIILNLRSDDGVERKVTVLASSKNGLPTLANKEQAQNEIKPTFIIAPLTDSQPYMYFALTSPFKGTISYTFRRL